MAHNLNEVDGKVAFAYTENGVKPWHGLGTSVPGAMTMAQAIQLGGLDWEVEKQALKTIPGIDVPDFFAMVRKDTLKALGVVGRGYEPVQNRSALNFFDYALGEGAAAIDTVGALGDGEVVWAMAKIPEVVEIVPGDPVEHYLLLMTSHDGSCAIKVLFTPVRVVCNNTLSAALRGARQTISIKHTKNVDGSLEQAHRLLAEGNKYWERVRAAFRWMARKQMTVETVNAFLDKMFPAKIKEKTTSVVDPETGETVTKTEEVAELAMRTKKTRDQIIRLFDGAAKGSELAGTSAWGLYNAVTEWVDWERQSRTGINNWQNSVFALGANVRQNAFEILTDGIPTHADLLQYVTTG